MRLTAGLIRMKIYIELLDDAFATKDFIRDCAQSPQFPQIRERKNYEIIMQING